MDDDLQHTKGDPPRPREAEECKKRGIEIKEWFEPERKNRGKKRKTLGLLRFG